MTCCNFSILAELCCYEDGGPLQWNRKWETISRGIWEDTERRMGLNAHPSTFYSYAKYISVFKLLHLHVTGFLLDNQVISPGPLYMCTQKPVLLLLISVFNLNREQATRGFKCKLMLHRDKNVKWCVYVTLIKPSMHVEISCDSCFNSKRLFPVWDLMLNSFLPLNSVWLPKLWPFHSWPWLSSILT